MAPVTYPRHSYCAVVQHPLDGCQFNPVERRGALPADAHFRSTRATVLVGSPHAGSIQYRLCAACAALPLFRKRRQHPIVGRK